MKALILYAGFVIAWIAAGVLISSYIERLTSSQNWHDRVAGNVFFRPRRFMDSHCFCHGRVAQ